MSAFNPHDRQFEVSDGDQSTSLPELLGAFSYALDLTEGQPPGHSLRACYIAVAVADRIGVDAQIRSTVYYATLLKDLGCSSNAARIAEVYLADDRQFKHDFKLIGDGIGPALRFVFARTGLGYPASKRAAAIVGILRNGGEIARSLIEARCTRGAEIARALRFPEEVAQGIHSLDEHWSGSGKPQGLVGDAIPLASRIALLAQVADVFFTNAGREAALTEVLRLSGKWFDPALCEAFRSLGNGPRLWEALQSSELHSKVAALLPEENALPVDEDYLDNIASAFGQVIDAKSPYTAGHSARVGDLANIVGGKMGLAGDDLRSLRRAAMLHDVGKLGVSCAILEKPGKLTSDEWVIMQGHAAQTAEILGRVGPLRRMAMVAASHHERLDGRGYPLGLDASMIAREARIITVCDFYDALTADRPYRAALQPEQAFTIMQNEAGGAIDASCFSTLKASL